ncbi:FecR family protein [Alteromonas sp. a30]|uniref:FecR family protein n=1 Tax=Alteromonas sp. a30 TaxID=2730917 RepID=UPI0022830477|nr:FecR domain-containing protein [Alteromonas sp. a30]MCY7297332.1 hypothetical protein [Alteromonas sp. a30]
MNNVVKLKQPDDVLDQASEWIAKLDRGLSTSEQRAFQMWMQQPQHADVLLNMATLWDKLDVLSRLADVCPEFNNPSAHQHRSTNYAQSPQTTESVKSTASTQRTTGSGFFAAAASVLFFSLLALTGGYVYYGDTSKQAPVVMHQERVQTAIGETLSRTLSDGSILTLNTNSRVNVTFTNQQRILELQYGELHIDVAHDKTRPLSVHAGGKIIQAVGTAFNVAFYNEKLALLVTEGTVRVAEKTPEEPANVRLPDTSLSLNKGEKSLLSAPQQTIESVAQADIDAILSWQQGVLTFRGESLQQALAEMSRYSSVNFEITDAALAQTQIVGVFKPQDVEALLAALQENFNIQYEKRGSNQIILKKSH